MHVIILPDPSSLDPERVPDLLWWLLFGSSVAPDVVVEDTRNLCTPVAEAPSSNSRLSCAIFCLSGLWNGEGTLIAGPSRLVLAAVDVEPSLSMETACLAAAIRDQYMVGVSTRY
jgi:hypothetical protein